MLYEVITRNAPDGPSHLPLALVPLMQGPSPMNVAATITAYDPAEVERVSSDMLAPLARKIDDERFYAEEVMRAYGAAGAYATHISGHSTSTDLTTAILAMA